MLRQFLADAQVAKAGGANIDSGLDEALDAEQVALREPVEQRLDLGLVRHRRGCRRRAWPDAGFGERALSPLDPDAQLAPQLDAAVLALGDQAQCLGLE